MTNAEIKRKSKSSQSDYMNREWNTQRMPSSAAGGYATGCYIFDQAWCLWQNWTILRVNPAKNLTTSSQLFRTVCKVVRSTIEITINLRKQW